MDSNFGIQIIAVEPFVSLLTTSERPICVSIEDAIKYGSEDKGVSVELILGESKSCNIKTILLFAAYSKSYGGCIKPKHRCVLEKLYDGDTTLSEISTISLNPIMTNNIIGLITECFAYGDFNTAFNYALEILE